MSDAFDPSAIYQLLGRTVTHLPASGGEVSGLAVLSVPGRDMFSGDGVVLEPALRFPVGVFSVKRGDSFVIGSDVWIASAPPTALHDGSECLVPVARSCP